MTWHAYIDRGSYLIVSPYRGVLNHQQIKRRIKREVGIFDAPDIQRARLIALAFEGVTK